MGAIPYNLYTLPHLLFSFKVLLPNLLSFKVLLPMQTAAYWR